MWKSKNWISQIPSKGKMLERKSRTKRLFFPFPCFLPIFFRLHPKFHLFPVWLKIFPDLLIYSVLRCMWEERRLHTRLISGELRSGCCWLNDGQVSERSDICSSSSNDDGHNEEMTSGWRGLFSFSSDDETNVTSSDWPEWDAYDFFKV